jgi:hypothetical protein
VGKTVSIVKENNMKIVDDFVFMGNPWLRKIK